MKANLLLLSYNRPEFLKESVESVLKSDYEDLQLIVLDDGSQFDVFETLDSFHDDRIVYLDFGNQHPEERAVKSRIASNINTGLELAREGWVFYLCDDDLLDQKWISRVMQFSEAYPKAHLIQGRMVQFFTNPQKDGFVSANRDSDFSYLWWVIGSFAHRAECYHEEGVRWAHTTNNHSQDIPFIKKIMRQHPDYFYMNKNSVYRRLHQGSLTSKLAEQNEK